MLVIKALNGSQKDHQNPYITLSSLNEHLGWSKRPPKSPKCCDKKKYHSGVSGTLTAP